MPPKDIARKGGKPTVESSKQTASGIPKSDAPSKGVGDAKSDTLNLLAETVSGFQEYVHRHVYH